MKKISLIKSISIISVFLFVPTFSFGQGTPNLIPYYGKIQKFGYCDKNKKVVIPYKYDLASPFVEGMAAVAVGSGRQKWGFINSKGEEVVPLNYDYVVCFSQGTASVNLNEKWGIVNKKGQLIIPCIYEGVKKLSEGRIGMQIDKKLVLYDTLGRKLSTIHTFTVETSFSEGRAVVQQYEKYGYIDLSGRIVIPFIYQNAHEFKEGFARVERSDSSIFIDKRGRRCFFPFMAAGDFSEGLAAVFNGKYGFINQSGKLVVPFMYDDFQEGFSCGLVAVKKDGFWGFIDSTGHVIVYGLVYGLCLCLWSMSMVYPKS